MGRTIGRQLHSVVETSFTSADQDTSWLAVEIDASVHTLKIYGIYPFVEVFRNNNLDPLKEFRVDLWRNFRLNREIAGQLSAQLDTSHSIERLWAMCYQKNSTWSTPFPHPLELPAGHVYTIGMDCNFDVLIGDTINQGLSVHGELIPAGVGLKL